MELRLDSFLEPTIEEAAKTIEPMAMKNGNRIVVDYWSDVSTIHADQARFRQSPLSLATNASSALILIPILGLVIAWGEASICVTWYLRYLGRR